MHVKVQQTPSQGRLVVTIVVQHKAHQLKAAVIQGRSGGSYIQIGTESFFFCTHVARQAFIHEERPFLSDKEAGRSEGRLSLRQNSPSPNE